VTPPTLVLDTNVLVSGLLNPHGAPGRLVDLLVAGDLTIAYDDRILAEYREVLARPAFPFEPRDVAGVLRTLSSQGLPVVPRPLSVDLPDPDDLPFLEVAVTAGVDALVSGNLRHFPQRTRPEGLRIEEPAKFLRSLRT